MNLDIESIFSSPAREDNGNDASKYAHDHIRNETKFLAEIYQGTIPDSPEKTLAIRKLQEAMMYANSAIAQYME